MALGDDVEEGVVVAATDGDACALADALCEEARHAVSAASQTRPAAQRAVVARDVQAGPALAFGHHASAVVAPQ